MRILAIEKDLPVTPAENIKELLRVEAACVWDLQKRGIIRDIWFTAADNLAVIMLECASVTEARQHLAMLPLVHAGVIGFTVHELRVYDGLERLFAHCLSLEPVAPARTRVNKPRRSHPAQSSNGREGKPAGPAGSGGHMPTRSSTIPSKS